MSTVLTTGANVTCGHAPGKVVLKSTAVLTVGKGAKPVLTGTGLVGATVDGCPLASGGAVGNVSCTAVTSVILGRSVTLKVNGEAVILDSLTGTTNGSAGGTTPQTLLSGADPSSALQVNKATP